MRWLSHFIVLPTYLPIRYLIEAKTTFKQSLNHTTTI